MDRRSGRIAAAVIGLGVGERHIASYESDPRCEVVLLCDIDPGKLVEVGTRHPGKRLTTDSAEVLNDPAIDVVSIASYDDVHCEQVLAAIVSGKHVFVEKPLCLHDEEFEAIDRALLERPDLSLSTNFILRRAPQFREVKARVDVGKLGRIFYMEGDYNYGRVHKVTEGWRGKLPFYSVTHGGAIHLIDLLLWLSRRVIVEVSAVGNQIATSGTSFRFPDMVTALLRFDDGMTAKVTANFGCVCPHHHNLAVYGTEGTFIHGLHGAAFHGSRDPHEIPERIERIYAREAKGDVQRSFVAHLLDGVAPEVTAAEVMDAMAVSLAIERSLNSHSWEPVRRARVSTAQKRGRR